MLLSFISDGKIKPFSDTVNCSVSSSINYEACISISGRRHVVPPLHVMLPDSKVTPDPLLQGQAFEAKISIRPPNSEEEIDYKLAEAWGFRLLHAGDDDDYWNNRAFTTEDEFLGYGVVHLLHRVNNGKCY